MKPAFLSLIAFVAAVPVYAHHSFVATYFEDKSVTVEGKLVDAPRGDDTTRIISMRKANRREQKIYQERLGEG